MKYKQLVAASTSLALVAGLSLATPSISSAQTSNAILTIGREGNTIFTRNFNPFSPDADLGTTTAIYEPLVIYTPTNEKFTPWLATSWRFGPNATSLTFTLRHGVKWSDGQPFTASDVAYTFSLLKKDFAGGGFPYVKSVVAIGNYTVKFSFDAPFSPALGQVGQQVIVPEHVWSKIPDPTKFTNPTPVGTGPFTQITSFSPQVYVIGRNPNYWQPGKPYFAGIRYPAFSGNDQVQEALVQGQIDWADIYVPNVQKTFVAKNPVHYYYFFSPTGYTVPLVLNTTEAPFNNVVVRKAISLAINRQADDASVYGSYVSASNSTGLSSGSKWLDKMVATSNNWTSPNIAKANQMLQAAGYKRGSDGVRVTPSGAKMAYTVETGVTSTDFVASAQNIAADLKAIGIDLTVVPKSWNAVISDVELGHFQLAHMYGDLGPTPYNFYDFFMSCKTVVPVGQEALQNWGRFCDKKATNLLAQLAATSDATKQTAITNQLETVFAADAPMIPLFTAPDWGEFNTTRFTGFPSAKDPYATGQSRYAGAFLIETTVKPVG
jgi:peptide/nickel transport system substrate-binding protein